MRARGDSADSRRAWSQICQDYWFPLYAYVRSRGKSAEDAEDITQDFFYHLISKDRLARADRGKGRLRSFLLVMLQRFDVSTWKKATAQRRGGENPIISLDITEAEQRLNLSGLGLKSDSPERDYDRKWAYALLEDAMRDLRKDMAARKQGEAMFRVIRSMLLDQHELSQEALAEQLGITDGNLRLILFRSRKRFLKFLRARVLDTLADPDQLEEELRYITSLFRPE